MKVLIIGGVAGGATAAARLRRLDESAQIIIFEKGAHISYANCGLPYYIGDEIPDRDKILLQTPESFNARFNVDVRVRHEVLAIDRAKKEVRVKNLADGTEYTERYDTLILSPGADPLVPPVPGINGKNIFTLRTVPDADTIKSFVKEHKPRRVVVVGAGYIGLEMAENLHRQGIFVTIIEMAPQVIAPLDCEMASLVHQHLKSKNVEFYLGEQVTGFTQEDGAVRVQLKSGAAISADFVVLSIGIKPETKLARAAGLAIGETGGIKVNEYLQSSDPAIYAVGDAIETIDPVFKLPRLVPLAGPANKQGRIAANNIVLGNTETYGGTVGTAVAKVFDMAVAVTGFSARLLSRQKVDYASVIIHSSSHAGYYPGALPLSLKLLFSRTDGKIYGGQVVGFAGADKAIETIALMCQFGRTVADLKVADHAYAPPFSSAKSPVNMLGFVAENLLTGKMKSVMWQEVAERDPESTVLLDVRTQLEYSLGAIPGAVNIPLDTLRQRLGELPAGKRIYVYCAVGLRAYVAARILTQNGFAEVYNISGGYKTWEAATMKQGNENIFDKYRIGKDNMIYSGGRDESVTEQPRIPVVEIDARGLQCPGPIMKLNDRMAGVAAGGSVRVLASDPGFAHDVKSWCNVTGNRLASVSTENGTVSALIEKGGGAIPAGGRMAATDKTIVIFNDDFDRALAAFVIANGGLSMGRKVTLFFTFWGLNILKKRPAPAVKKDFISRMFSLMLPTGVPGLKMSKLNMFGMGPLLMKHIMKKKNIEALDSLLAHALSGGARVIACQMSMDVMGIKREELIDGIEIGGVATYIEASESASMNLFI